MSGWNCIVFLHNFLRYFFSHTSLADSRAHGVFRAKEVPGHHSRIWQAGFDVQLITKTGGPRKKKLRLISTCSRTLLLSKLSLASSHVRSVTPCYLSGKADGFSFAALPQGEPSPSCRQLPPRFLPDTHRGEINRLEARFQRGAIRRRRKSACSGVTKPGSAMMGRRARAGSGSDSPRAAALRKSARQPVPRGP